MQNYNFFEKIKKLYIIFYNFYIKHLYNKKINYIQKYYPQHNDLRIFQQEKGYEFKFWILKL